MINQIELINTPVLDDPVLGEIVYLSETEARKIAGWLDSVFENGIENYPWGAVGAALCCETHLLDSQRALTDAEIDRILAAIWWEGARCGEGE
jgi:hypothetical protein